ncbi:MAG: DUF4390 domain-containing protein [Thermodesulfovibrionales bacterium]|nr:DUF4390 domain-containing protein [Thermodesulfovibrionales bacterium]
MTQKTEIMQEEEPFLKETSALRLRLKKLFSSSASLASTFLCITSVLLFLLFLTTCLLAQEIGDIDVRMNGDELVVSTSVILPENFINEIKNGIQKELVFYIDLFRVWKNWPDEYIFGNSIVRKIEGDVIKGEYVMSSFDRNRKIIVEKKFKTLESMLSAMSVISSLSLINIKGIEPGDYYIKVTVESRLRRLPPVVGYLLFFIPEKEFSISRDSAIFRLSSK